MSDRKESKTKTMMGGRSGILRKWWVYALPALLAVACVLLVLVVAQEEQLSAPHEMTAKFLMYHLMGRIEEAVSLYDNWIFRFSDID